MNRKVNPKRILSLDLLRGYFLLVITIDHFFRFPSVWELFTGEGRLWVSAAEGFFIISGILIGLLQQRFEKLWKRAGKLYIVSVVLTLIFTVWGELMESNLIKFGIDVDGGFKKLILNTVTLKYTYGWADFLPYYVVFLFFSPLILNLLKKKKLWVVLLVSFLFWLVRGNNFYLAWQILFFGGICIGFYKDKILKNFSKLTKKYKFVIPFIFGITVITIILSILSVGLDLNIYPGIFDKDTLGPGRLLLSGLWFACLFILFKKYEDEINKKTFGVINFLGQNSLLVYVIHAIILFPLDVWTPPNSGFIFNTVYTLVVILLLFLTTKFVRALPLFKKS